MPLRSPGPRFSTGPQLLRQREGKASQEGRPPGECARSASPGMISQKSSASQKKEEQIMIRNMEEFVSAFKAARRVSTPLVTVRTADPASSLETVARLLNGQGEETPILVWDIMHGLAGVNRTGKAEATRLLDGGDPAMVSARPSDALALAEKLGEDSILFFSNAHRFYTDAVV